MKPPSSVPLVLNAADKEEGRICLSLSPSVSTHICVNTVIWRVCVFKMMDRVMLLVNNSPRCRLRSRCPSHLGQSAGIQPALWLEETRERPRPLCKTEPLSSIPRFWVNTRVLKLNLSLFLCYFLLSSSPSSCPVSLLPSLTPSADPSASRRSEKHRLHPDANLLERE